MPPSRCPKGRTCAFAYSPAGPNALDGITVTFRSGTLTAFVGHSGSGKSTLARLLLRHADPTGGSIRMGGALLPSIPPAQLAACVSVVFQDVFLFNDTVMANIRMGRPSATDDDVRAAARAALCTDFIEKLANGWDTVIGDGGGRLSGGERQRLSIATALLKDAPIVILDEPTTTLDTESEVAVQAAIDVLAQDRTVLVIAHRLATVVAAHQILVFDHGRIVERGRHNELLARRGV